MTSKLTLFFGLWALILFTGIAFILYPSVLLGTLIVAEITLFYQVKDKFYEG